MIPNDIKEDNICKIETLTRMYLLGYTCDV